MKYNHWTLVAQSPEIEDPLKNTGNLLGKQRRNLKMKLRSMAAADREEVVYKLTLKYLRQDGYDIGNYKNPFVRKK